MVYKSMTQNPTRTWKKTKQRNSAFIAVLHLKVVMKSTLYGRINQMMRRTLVS